MHYIHIISLNPSIFLPPKFTKTHLIKPRHRLIRTPNLHLEERRLQAITLRLRTLHIGLLGIIPCALAAEDVFADRLGEGLALEVAFGDDEGVRAGMAFEAVVGFGVDVGGGRGVGGGNSEDVGAGGADWGSVSEYVRVL